MTRYYMRRLLQQNAVPLGLATEPIPVTDDSEDSAFWDQMMRLETLATTKVVELDLLVRLHQSLSRHGISYRAYLNNLEKKLFSLMGLALNDLSSVEEPTMPLPGPDQLSMLVQPVPTLAQALDLLNQVSLVSKQYLGGLITRNYWQSTRPHSSWFVDYDINAVAEITFRQRASEDLFLTPEQVGQLQIWLDAFVSQCQRVLPQFSQMLKRAGVQAKVQTPGQAIQP